MPRLVVNSVAVIVWNWIQNRPKGREVSLCIYLNGWENGSWQGKLDGERVLERKKTILTAVVKMGKRQGNE